MLIGVFLYSLIFYFFLFFFNIIYTTMNFTLLPSTSRRGCLLLSGKQAIATPGCLFNCIRGSVPHLTPDMLARVGPKIIQVPLAHLYVEPNTVN
jgi:hypothetical protein